MTIALNEPLNHSTITTYSSVFGTLFSEIYLLRENGNKTVWIPIEYAGRQKANTRVEQNENPNDLRYKITYPRLAFELTDISMDLERNRNKQHQLSNRSSIGSNYDELKTQYNRIPYNFQYRLYLGCKNIEDMMQLIEQIIVNFNPGIDVEVEDNPDLNQSSNIQIRLNSVDFENSYEGAFDEDQILQATFDFTLKGHLYQKTSESGGLIQKVIINYWDLKDTDHLYDQQIITPDNDVGKEQL